MGSWVYVLAVFIIIKHANLAKLLFGHSDALDDHVLYDADFGY
jgi:hypothetical protein